MAIETTFFRDLAYVFGAAVVGGSVARLLRQPLILGYVLGGFLIGPFTPGPTLSEVHEFVVLAEIGVILLMYSIGLEFSFSELLQVKWVAVFGAPLGILLSIGMGVGMGRLMGWSLPRARDGCTVSVASTMVLSRLLADRGELRSSHGHVMIGITLVEDLAVVVLTVLLPSLTSLTGSHLLSLGVALGKAMLIITPVMFVAAKLVPPLMKRVGRAGNEELYVLVVLALGFATAAVTQAVDCRWRWALSGGRSSASQAPPTRCWINCRPCAMRLWRCFSSPSERWWTRASWFPSPRYGEGLRS
jgi:CPA2 family monovalent cation:H+ antiporter-2